MRDGLINELFDDANLYIWWNEDFNVSHTFLKQGHLTHIPARLAKRQVINVVIIKEFEPDREYTEIEVNRILLEFHKDVAALRRGLVSEQMMERGKGIYRRVANLLVHIKSRSQKLRDLV